ncbi:MAG TPA: hypothetical protein VMA30_20800 [Xanthobacteraceae bacterium]|nr:hypothetical protein [Xanthobacteraceae bacterium]
MIRLITGENAATSGQADNSAAARKTRPRRSARRKHGEATTTARETDQHADPARSNAPADASVAVAASATPENSASAAPPAPVDNAQTAESDQAHQDNAPSPSAVVIDGETVVIAAADQINALDLAAEISPPTASALPRGDRADGGGIDASGTSPAAFVARAPVATEQYADAEAIGPQDANMQTDDQNAEAQNSSAIGGDTRVAQLLAALSGAITAGVIAWFLIGAGPMRTHS